MLLKIMMIWLLSKIPMITTTTSKKKKKMMIVLPKEIS